MLLYAENQLAHKVQLCTHSLTKMNYGKSSFERSAEEIINI
jgi:hypothetical protein